MWHKDTPAIEGGNIVLKGAIRAFPVSPPMTLIYILAESSVEIAGAGPHVETLHESWPGWPLALDHFHEFACSVPEIRATAADLQIGVTVAVVPLAEPAGRYRQMDRTLRTPTRPRRRRLGNPTHPTLLAPRVDLSIVVNGRDAVIRDDAEAAIWCRRAAEQGNTYAQTFLGLMYANGKGVPENDAEAVRWYRLAAQQGNATAQSNLGVMYANGEGVLKDDAEAVRWYRLAAEQGHAIAQFNLGLM